MHRLPWLTFLLLLACDDEKPSGEEKDAAVPDSAVMDARVVLDAHADAERLRYDGSHVAPGVDLTVPHHIVRRECAEWRYAASFVITPAITCSGRSCGPGIECTRPEDCTASPHGRCLTSATGQCDLGAGPVQNSACVTDGECGPSGRCGGVILQTFCQYNNQCASSADCAQGSVCDCGSSGDLACFKAECSRDEDCPGTTVCQRGNPCGYGPFGNYRCTTAQDECDPRADADAGCVCDFDESLRHWKCNDIICD